METNNNEVNERTYCEFMHPNNKCTGSAVKLFLRPADGNKGGAIILEIAMQKFNGCTISFPTFDWANKLVIALTREDIVEFLKTLRGMQESIAGSKGLYHHTSRANTVIKLLHQIEPCNGYALSISRKSYDNYLSNAWFMFDTNEAFILNLLLEQALFYVCFGVPKISHL